MSNAERSIYLSKWCDYIEPDPILTVSEWADLHRRLPSKSAAEPGQWRTSRTPYLKEIMDCLSASSPTETVTFMKSAQIGGTECGNNFIGYIIDCVPGPTMFVQKTAEAAMKVSRGRIDPLIKDTPRLASKVARKNSKEEANTVLIKDFLGGQLVLTGANSPVGLRSMPVKNLILDELSSYEDTLKNEGDPAALAIKRTETFKRRKVFKISTPTVSGHCRIERDYLKSDMRKFLLPCPHCKQRIEFDFINLKWESGQPETAKYYCNLCGEEIDENKHKQHMLSLGEWKATNSRPSNRRHAGFHINALYSPWKRWEEVAKEYEEAKESPHLMQVFVNTVLGLAYQSQAETPDWRTLYDRREQYPLNSIPDGVLFMGAAVDVQRNRIEVEVMGWGRKNISWSIDRRVIEGDVSTDGPWGQLEGLLSETWSRTDGVKLPLRYLVVDTGYMSQKVYQWCRKWNTSRVFPIKGVSGPRKSPISNPTMVDIKLSTGQKIKSGLKIWTIAVDPLKEEAYAWLKIRKPTEKEFKEAGEPFGYCHFPEYDEEYFKQLCAERQTSKMKRGFKQVAWEKVRDRNETLDLRVYNRAGAMILGIERFKDVDWDNIKAKPKVNPIKSTNEDKKATSNGIIRRKSDFL